GSGDLTFAPMLVEAGLAGLPIILSTGMANLDEIKRALEFIAFGQAQAAGIVPTNAVPTRIAIEAAWAAPAVQNLLVGTVTILHCTTQYPASPHMLNLRAMTTIAERFGLPVGYSDHSLGRLASTIAVTLGATVIEKHFTLDKTLEGPDHSASLDADELVEFVRELREVEVMLGSKVKECQPEEVANREVVRRSIVATRPIAQGATIETIAVECRRPLGGRTSFDYWEVVGTIAERDYEPGEYVG
ncbi:MAG: N-acetylneuraminate synthase family protein, partial [Rhodoglobus sp.]|nr:N-acetylneuraminate synthase family protein [Rhodoglobus sp.]